VCHVADLAWLGLLPTEHERPSSLYATQGFLGKIKISFNPCLLVFHTGPRGLIVVVVVVVVVLTSWIEGFVHHLLILVTVLILDCRLGFLLQQM
jgi:hypothetical protein